MKILFLPIDIEISKIDLSKINLSNLRGGKYQPFWKTNDITSTSKELKLILDQLPFDRITKIYFKEQITFVGPHCDVYSDMEFEDGEYENIIKNDPSGYRIVLHGNNDSLYVKYQEEFKMAKLPTIPGCYLIHATEGCHLVKTDPGRKIIYVRGFINSKKHNILIEKSLHRYREFAIIE